MMIEMVYRNWRGDIDRRRITPKSIRYGSTDWHPESGWLLLAWDHDKQADREFALADCDFRTRPKIRINEDQPNLATRICNNRISASTGVAHPIRRK